MLPSQIYGNILIEKGALTQLTELKTPRAAGFLGLVKRLLNATSGPFIVNHW